MKRIIKSILLISILSIIVGYSCSNKPNSEVNTCNCIMDTLKGEWSWVKTYGGFFGNTTDNEFSSIIKILNQNEDTSINYEVFADGTLFYKGSFHIQTDQWNRKKANINLPHETYGMNIVWELYFFNILEREYNDEAGHFENKPSKEDLTFWDGGEDGHLYIYKRIK